MDSSLWCALAGIFSCIFAALAVLTAGVLDTYELCAIGGGGVEETYRFLQDAPFAAFALLCSPLYNVANGSTVLGGEGDAAAGTE